MALVLEVYRLQALPSNKGDKSFPIPFPIKFIKILMDRSLNHFHQLDLARNSCENTFRLPFTLAL